MDKEPKGIAPERAEYFKKLHVHYKKQERGNWKKGKDT
jgi:hypothetical protein